MAAVPAVVEATETFDTTTIRASTPQYLLSRYISESTDVRVVLSGEGADEALSGYVYSKYAPSASFLLCKIHSSTSDNYITVHLLTPI